MIRPTKIRWSACDVRVAGIEVPRLLAADAALYRDIRRAALKLSPGAFGGAGGAVASHRAGLSQAGQRPSAGWGGAPAADLFLAAGFNLSDPAAEEALYDLPAMRGFVGIDLGREPGPDETTVCRFRHLLEAHDLGLCSTRCSGIWRQRGLKVATGTIVDATIINAPSSTKNAQKARDPDMHQTKKRNQWYFGMKAHLGVDSRTKLIHAVVATPADVADSTVLPELLHGNETRVWGRSSLSRPARGDPLASSEGETSSTAAIASAASWTRSSARETAATRRCGPESSI
jgi:IS5 family transposase